MTQNPQKNVYLSLGSNLGNRDQNLNDAIAALQQTGISVLKSSSKYETEPVGFRNQPWFLNCVVEIETSLTPQELLVAIVDIERAMGRNRTAQTICMGPRIIDIDIVLFGHEIIQSENLTIPHPHMAERKFVLLPLDEIAPNAIYPPLGRTIHELLEENADRNVVRLWVAIH